MGDTRRGARVGGGRRGAAGRRGGAVPRAHGPPGRRGNARRDRGLCGRRPDATRPAGAAAAPVGADRGAGEAHRAGAGFRRLNVWEDAAATVSVAGKNAGGRGSEEEVTKDERDTQTAVAHTRRDTQGDLRGKLGAGASRKITFPLSAAAFLYWDAE